MSTYLPKTEKGHGNRVLVCNQLVIAVYAYTAAFRNET